MWIDGHPPGRKWERGRYVWYYSISEWVTEGHKLAPSLSCNGCRFEGGDFGCGHRIRTKLILFSILPQHRLMVPAEGEEQDNTGDFGGSGLSAVTAMERQARGPASRSPLQRCPTLPLPSPLVGNLKGPGGDHSTHLYLWLRMWSATVPKVHFWPARLPKILWHQYQQTRPHPFPCCMESLHKKKIPVVHISTCLLEEPPPAPSYCSLILRPLFESPGAR